MPELAEVEYFRTRWNKGLGSKVLSVHLNPGKKVFRGTDTSALEKVLTGATLEKSEAHGKQLLFRFTKNAWLGLHMGMTGELRMEPPSFEPLKHDHLILRQARQSLVFNDPRQFGRVLFHQGKTEPKWWGDRPAQILSKHFTVVLVDEFLKRHGRAPIKAALLMQSGFPGIGNWMADEILWQSRIHPDRAAGKLTPAETKALFAKTQFICRESLRIVGKEGAELPKSWLFHHRWERGGKCPRHGRELRREEIGGRTTCWCPSCQRL